VPAAVEHVGDLRGDARHLRLVLAQALNRLGDVPGELCPVELVVVGGQRDVAAVLGEDVVQPVGELDIAVARAFGLPQRLHEGVVAEAVELSGHRFEADVAHGVLRSFS